MSNIKFIMEDKSERPSHPLGYLTSQNRDVWAQTRDNLLASGESVSLGSSDAGYEMHEFGICALTPILKAILLVFPAGEPSTSPRFPRGFMGEFQGIIPVEISS